MPMWINGIGEPFLAGKPVDTITPLADGDSPIFNQADNIWRFGEGGGELLDDIVFDTEGDIVYTIVGDTVRRS